MGIAIAKFKHYSQNHGHVSQGDDFATDMAGRLLPAAGESFETMPLGSLAVLAFSRIGQRYNQNPYAAPAMPWEIGFSQRRLSFFSPQTNALFGGVKQRPGQSTLGFNYYNELRSLSLVAAENPGGPYVSTVFVIQATAHMNLPLGVRLHGALTNLRAFSTMLAARFLECYAQLSAQLGLNISALSELFERVDAFDFEHDDQVDLFVVAEGNSLSIKAHHLDSEL